MFKIRDWLFTGSFQTATHAASLKAEQIKALLTLYRPVKLADADIEVLFLPVNDGHPIPPKAFEVGVQFVRQHHDRQQHVLIACGAGISRSVTFATAVLHEVEGLSLRDAFFSIRAHNAEALPDHVHWQSLAEYYGDSLDYWTLWSEIVDVE